MQVLQESVVQSDEIDSLGHMNVRYYVSRMEQANRQLIELSGVSEHVLQRGLLLRVDTYTRFWREQFEGAPLHTLGGVLELGEGGIRTYLEVRNAASEEVAATFVVTTALFDHDTRKPLALPARADELDPDLLVTIPRYAQPRSLSLGPVRRDLPLQQLEESIPEVEGGGMMSGRRQAVIEPEDVDTNGWLKEDVELMFLPFAKQARQEGGQMGPPVFYTADGRRVGWAVMETRTLTFAYPRLGDTLAYFSADLTLEARSRLSRRWAFNRDSGRLLGISDTVGVCIDLQARRAIEWPDELRSQIEQYLQPQLA